MPVSERNLRLLVIDQHRVVILEGRKAPEELHGPRRRAAMALLGIVDPTPDYQPQQVQGDLHRPELPGTDDPPEPAPLALPPPPPPPPPLSPPSSPDISYGDGSAAPRRHLKHSNYRPAVKPPLSGASALILTKLGEYDVAIPFNQLRRDMRPMPDGTVSSRLISLVEGGYVVKSNNPTADGRARRFYQITPKGLDFLTRPEGIDDAGAQAVVEAVEAATAAGITIRVFP